MLLVVEFYSERSDIGIVSNFVCARTDSAVTPYNIIELLYFFIGII